MTLFQTHYLGGFSNFVSAFIVFPAGGPGGSQGFGNNLGVGMLLDHEGRDSYEIVGGQQSPARRDGVTIGPDSTCPTTTSTCSGGVFIDQ